MATEFLSPVLVLSLIVASFSQENIGLSEWNSIMMSYEVRAKAIEEMAKRAAFIQNTRNQLIPFTEEVSTLSPISAVSAPAMGGVFIDKRPTIEDDLTFLKKMKEQSEIYEKVAEEVRNPYMTSIPAPPYIPYKSMPYFFIPSSNLFPLPGSRIFARPSSLKVEGPPRQQLPLRGL